MHIPWSLQATPLIADADSCVALHVDGPALASLLAHA
jgi:hypothetical protein